MDFELPSGLLRYLAELDAFIDAEIAPLQAADDNQRFFDHRREWARTDFDRGGLPRQEWENLLAEARRPPAFRLAGGVRRARWRQPVDGRDPRAPRRPGAWACTTTCRTSTPSWATTPLS
jgi:hypothetical protein